MIYFLHTLCKHKQKKYKYTEIFALIPSFVKEGLLTEDEKKSLKQYIITKNPDLSLEMKGYNENKDKRKLVESLKIIAGITQMSSPVDTGLILKKRKNGRKKAPAKKEEKPQDLGIQDCDFGQSPVVNTRTPIFRESDDDDDDDDE